MAQITIPIEAHDNALGCRLYGAKQPETGRNATENEFKHIRQWIRSAQLIEEFLDGSNGTNESQNKILIDLIRGNPIRITPLAENTIHLVDGGGAVRILRQAELRVFLDTL
ncbi:hypothetical protein [Alicyclobacillus ferrooxydans]|nr:hypothetical protein [Alicyclobacillus ferrooxydans]